MLVVAALVVMLGLLFGAALTSRPSWYVPTSVDQARLAADKRDLVNLLDEIGVALNSGRSIDLEIGEDQLNRWIRARSQWPTPPPAELQLFDFPQVSFPGPQQVRAAATIEFAGQPWVLSVTARIEPTADEFILHWETLAVGRIPMPRRWISLFLGDDGHRGGPILRNLVQNGHWVVPARATWKNGNRPFRIRDIGISQGVLRVSLVPLGPEPKRPAGP